MVVHAACGVGTVLCCAGWKGTWVCENDKHKAMEMYKVR